MGIGSGEKLLGVALNSNPDKPIKISELNNLREKVWLELGEDTKSRYQIFSEACAPFKVDVPHIHLNMIGILHEAQGMGLAGKLMQEVDHLSQTDSHSEGITLTTEDPQKVSFYEYMGYRIIGEAHVAEHLNTWSFFKSI